MGQRAWQPLNPYLYQRLCNAYGKKNINVEHAGHKIEWVLQSEFHNGERRFYREVISPGEEYRLNCPFCGDNKQRLYINHRWNVEDPDTGSSNLHLANCFNEMCLPDYQNSQQLIDLLFLSHKPVLQSQVRAGTISESETSAFTVPGKVVPLKELAVRKPSHPALLYLSERNFDVDYLIETYKLGFVVQSSFAQVRQRILIPVYFGGRLRGWQARYVGDVAQDGRDFKSAGIRKYYNMPGSWRRDKLYCFDYARQHKTQVIVEGAMDAWAFGLEAAGTLGTSLNYQHVELLYKANPKGSIVLLLDPEMPKQTGRKDHYGNIKEVLHPMEKAKKKLLTRFADRQIAVVFLKFKDPGVLHRSYLLPFVEKEAKAQNVKVWFKS